MVAIDMIEFKKLNKIYTHHHQTVQVLNQINLSICKGEIFGVLGRSGAGKSTLLRCANLLEKPTSGEVWFDGVNLTKISVSALRKQRRRMGMIFQHFNLLESRTAFGNIALPLEIMGKSSKEIEKKVSDLLELVELSNRQHYFPNQLSGGQKQRVAIARALASDPEVLLSDEATSALDEVSTQSILRLLNKIRKELGLTILLVTHQREVARQLCDRIGFLEHGEWVHQGSAGEVLGKLNDGFSQEGEEEAAYV